MATVTKKDLVDLVAEATQFKRTEVRDTLQSLLDIMVEQLGQGNRLEFRDFGVFEVRARKARKAQNPRTLEPVKVPPKRTVKFKPGRLMRDRLDLPERVEANPLPLNPSLNGTHAPSMDGQRGAQARPA